MWGGGRGTSDLVAAGCLAAAVGLRDAGCASCFVAEQHCMADVKCLLECLPGFVASPPATSSGCAACIEARGCATLRRECTGVGVEVGGEAAAGEELCLESTTVGRVNAACSADGGGVAAQCSPACAAVLPAWWSTCGRQLAASTDPVLSALYRNVGALAVRERSSGFSTASPCVFTAFPGGFTAFPGSFTALKACADLDRPSASPLREEELPAAGTDIALCVLSDGA